MTNREAIKILERRSTIPDDDASWEEIMEAIDIAIQSIKIVSFLESRPCACACYEGEMLNIVEWAERILKKEKEI